MRLRVLGAFLLLAIPIAAQKQSGKDNWPSFLGDHAAKAVDVQNLPEAWDGEKATAIKSKMNIPALVGINIKATRQGRGYPKIRPVHITIETTASKPDAAGHLTINDALGKPAYVLGISAISSDNLIIPEGKGASVRLTG